MNAVTTGTGRVIAERLWRVLAGSGFSPESSSTKVLHVTGAFDSSWLARLPVAIGEHRTDGQEITLLGGPKNIERWREPKDIEVAYAALPRTRVCENLGEVGGGWVKSVEILLAAASGFSVGSSAYQSFGGDASLHAHFDQWIGVILQLQGSKVWHIQHQGRGPVKQLITKAGHVLLMPPDVQHEASTPEYSVHINFEIFTQEPLFLPE